MTLQKKVRKLHRKMMWQMKDDHKNGNVFQEDGSFCRETLYIRNHRLTEAFEETSEEEVIDAEGLMVIPGLVDIHSHGAYGEDFSDGDPEGLKKS